MGTLSLFCISPLSLSYPPPSHTHLPSSSPTLSSSHFSSFSYSPPSFRPKPKPLVFGCNPRDIDSSSSQFFDQDGVLHDMDGYLNHLSLEYDSVWDTKPSWCQPWTIALTGISVVACSWLILHSVIVTAIIFLLICIWWYIFLYSYPKAYSEMIAERRKNVTSGVEDTYGWKKNQ